VYLPGIHTVFISEEEIRRIVAKVMHPEIDRMHSVQEAVMKLGIEIEMKLKEKCL